MGRGGQGWWAYGLCLARGLDLGMEMEVAFPGVAVLWLWEDLDMSEVLDDVWDAWSWLWCADSLCWDFRKFEEQGEIRRIWYLYLTGFIDLGELVSSCPARAR